MYQQKHPGLLMRAEHSETKTETETKNMLWDRDQKYVMRPRPKTTRPVQSSKLHVKVTQIGMFYYTHEVND